MNKQVIYAILTISLIPLGMLLVFLKMTSGDTTTYHVPVKIVTDNIAYKQIASSVAGDSGKVTLVSTGLTSKKDQKAVQSAEIIITDTHNSALLVKRQKDNATAKVLIASDGIKNKIGDNYWLSPKITVQMITRVTNLLSDFDPKSHDVYTKNMRTLFSQIQSLTKGIDALSNKKNVQYIATNNAQQVFMKQLNYQRDNIDIETATQDDFDDLTQKFKDKKIQFILTAPQDQSENEKKLISLAKQSSIPIVTVNQVLPSNQKVWEWQLTFVQKLGDALKVQESGN